MLLSHLYAKFFDRNNQTIIIYLGDILPVLRNVPLNMATMEDSDPELQCSLISHLCLHNLPRVISVHTASGPDWSFMVGHVTESLHWSLMFKGAFPHGATHIIIRESHCLSFSLYVFFLQSCSAIS